MNKQKSLNNTTIHVTLPAAAGWLFKGLPLLTLGWDDRHVDADMDLTAWDDIASWRKTEIMRIGEIFT